MRTGKTWTGVARLNYNGTNAQHVAFATKYDILPTADDPLYTFNVNTPVNNKDAKIHGFEFGGQYFFGDSGFGVLANYTDRPGRRRLRRDQRSEREPVRAARVCPTRPTRC